MNRPEDGADRAHICAESASCKHRTHYEQQRRHNPCGYARCHPDAKREPRCLGGCGVKSPEYVAHDIPRLYPERHGRNACHKAEHIDCKHMIAERTARLIAELAAHKRKTLAKRYEYILKRAHRTHRRAIHPPEYKRYPDPHQDNTHICGYQRRHYLHSLHHPRHRQHCGAYQKISRRSCKKQRGEYYPYGAQIFHRRPFFCCSRSMACCCLCISSRRAMNPLFFLGFFAFSAIVFLTSSSFMIKRNA